MVIKLWKDFDSLKATIVDQIANADIHVDKEKCCGSGIYMLYVDCFVDDKIIPFYIGKTMNFQSRYQAHLRDIRKLTEYSYAEYHHEFLLGAVGLKCHFDGKYRPCKILKYILDHDCSIEDVKMIVMEHCDKDHLDEREQYYISLYLPSFFGFNQIKTITEQFRYKDNPKLRKNIIEEDRENFRLYMRYGFSAFNYLHSFASFGDDGLNEKIDLLISNNLWPSSSELFTKVVSEAEIYKRIHKEALVALRERYGKEVHSIFEQCKLKSSAREDEVFSVFANSYYSPVVDDVNNVVNYLKYYFDRDKKSRECGKLLHEFYIGHLEEIVEISKLVEKAFKSYVESRSYALDKSRFSMIFPNQPFEFD